MDKYRSLAVWRRAHEVVLLVLRSADAHYHPRSRALFDQMRRAAISVEANIVEGYALGTSALFRRHVRIALGSAAETECLVRIAAEMDYLPQSVIVKANGQINETIAMLFTLLRRPLTLRDPSHHRNELLCAPCVIVRKPVIRRKSDTPPPFVPPSSAR